MFQSLSGGGQYNFQDELQDEIPETGNFQYQHGEDSEEMEGNDENQDDDLLDMKSYLIQPTFFLHNHLHLSNDF